MLAPLSLLALLSSTLADAIPDTTGLEATYALQQRIFAESVSSPTAWTQRSLLLLKETPECVPNGLTPLPLDRSAMYQLAIKREGMDESSWPMLSIPAARSLFHSSSYSVRVANKSTVSLHWVRSDGYRHPASERRERAAALRLHDQCAIERMSIDSKRNDSHAAHPTYQSHPFETIASESVRLSTSLSEARRARLRTGRDYMSR